MKKILLVLIASIFLVVGGVAFAQSHALTINVIGFGALNLNPGNAVALQLDSTGVTGGDNAVTDSDNGNWLQYTFIATGATSHVDVELTAATLDVPGWLTLQLVASTPVGAFGTPGTGNTRTLTDALGVQQLITGIGSTYTGTGVGEGSQLTYNLAINNWTLAAPLAAPLSYTVTFTAVP